MPTAAGLSLKGDFFSQCVSALHYEGNVKKAIRRYKFHGAQAYASAFGELVAERIYEDLDGKYDIITVNPPYIPSSDIEGLDAEVRDYEPRMALDGRADGLHFYRAICADAGRFLTEGGRLFAEIGAEQGAEVRALMERAGFQEVDVVRDLSGRDRVALGVFRNV